MKFSIESEEWYGVLDSASGYADEAVLNFRDKGILIRVQDKSQTGLYNCFIPEDIMSEYKQGEHPRIGIYTEKMLLPLPNSDDEVTVSHEGRKFQTQVQNRKYTTPNIDPDSVSTEPETVPDISMPIKVKLNPDKLLGFIKEASEYVWPTDAGHFYIQAEEGLLILWSKHDDYQLSEDFHWEDFQNYKISWSNTTQSDDVEGNPSEEKKATSIFSIALTKSMSFTVDNVMMEMGHYMPIKFVAESESGVKHSWIIPPRLPDSDDPARIPESIIRDRTVVA